MKVSKATERNKNRIYTKLLEVIVMAYYEKLARINLTTGTITVEKQETNLT
mgnify:CR=1 FL=1